MTLAEVHAALRAGLAPLDIDVGLEVLAVWRDREAHACQPFPAEALQGLARLVGELVAECKQEGERDA